MEPPSRSQRVRQSEGGFTLIEVLVAIVILSIGLLGMASLTIGIIKGNKLSNDLTTATTLAQDKMEQIRNSGYSALPSSDTTDTEDYGEIPDYPQYKRVRDTDVDAPATNMKTVTVTVYWDSDNHNIEIKSILVQQ